MSHVVSIKNTLVSPLKAVLRPEAEGRADIARTTHNIPPLDVTQIRVPQNVNLIEIRDSETDVMRWQNYVPAGVTLDIVSSDGKNAFGMNTSQVYGVILGDTKLTSSGTSGTSSSSQWWWWVVAVAVVILIIVIVILSVFLSKRKRTGQTKQTGGRRPSSSAGRIPMPSRSVRKVYRY